MSDIPRPEARKRKRIDAGSLQEALKVAGCEHVLNHGVPLNLEMPYFEDIIAATGMPRASVYRAFPYKHMFGTTVLETLVERKIYDATRVKEAAKAVLSEDRVNVPRENLLVRLGLLQVTQINHAVDSHLEVAVRSLPDDEVRERIGNTLSRRKGILLDTIGVVYIEGHHKLDEEIDDPKRYAVDVANLARSYALTAFGETDKTTLEAGFLSLAAVHTLPRMP